MDGESFAAMRRQFLDRGIDIVIDYEHQTLKDVQAPAAGWIKELFLEDDAIAAKVEWTPAARQYLENKEYRYLSPVVYVNKASGKAYTLHSAALTNSPAISGMYPIVNSITFEGGNETMDLLKKLAALLGLTEDAAEEEILKALEGVLKDTEAKKEEAGVAGAASEEAEKMVANKTDFDFEGEIKILKAKIADRDAEDTVLMALKAGKLAAVQREWAKEYALKDPTGFEKFVEKSPQIVPMGKLETQAFKSETPDDATLLICKQIGVTAEDVKKYGKERV